MNKIPSQQEIKHLNELQALGYVPNELKPLKNVERQAHRMNEAEANGEKEFTGNEWDKIRYRVHELFGNKYPAGFFINHDPRGYALKLESDTGTISYRDMGGYEILAPDFK